MDCILDNKVEMLQVAHGPIGFSVLVHLWMEVYQTADGEVNISNVLQRKTLALRAYCDVSQWEDIVNTCVDIGLFERDAHERGILTSNGIRQRLQKVAQEREKNRNRNPGSSTSQNLRKTGESKRKVKHGRDTSNDVSHVRKATPSSVEEVAGLFQQRGYPIAEAERFWNHYQANGWKVGRNAMKDWKAAAANWNKNAGKYDSPAKRRAYMGGGV